MEILISILKLLMDSAIIIMVATVTIMVWALKRFTKINIEKQEKSITENYMTLKELFEAHSEANRKVNEDLRTYVMVNTGSIKVIADELHTFLNDNKTNQ